MSYDIDIIDPITYEVLETDSPHFIRGGTYCVDGSCKLSLNITYNYAPFFQQAFNDSNGLKILHNKLAYDAIPLIQNALLLLKDDATNNYWDATEGNAKKALYSLLALCKMRPDGVCMIY